MFSDLKKYRTYLENYSIFIMKSLLAHDEQVVFAELQPHSNPCSIKKLHQQELMKPKHSIRLLLIDKIMNMHSPIYKPIAI